MKRGLVAWLSILPAALWVLLSRSRSSGLLADSDTAVLLATIRQRGAPFSWFVGDWPLFNHFYRPVATLFFEADNALYRDSAGGYAWTNAGLMAACVLALYGLTRNLLPLGQAIAATWLYTFWILDRGGLPLTVYGPLALLAGFVMVSRSGFRSPRAWLCACALYAFGSELRGIEPLYYRSVGWLPGRTASTCTLFILLSLWLYARHLKLSAERREDRTVTPLDPPATSSTVAEPDPRRANGLFIGAIAMALVALGSYEQAVMLPALVFGVGVLLNRVYRVHFAPQVAFWGCLVGYLVLRAAIIPVKPSGYQAQQFRNGGGVLLSLYDYISPNLRSIGGVTAPVSVGPGVLMFSEFWRDLFSLVGGVSLWFLVDRRRLMPMAAWGALSFFAFLPMAFLKTFEHYHILPMALRAGFVVVAGAALIEAAKREASPRAVRAPARSVPAPGSLPHL